MGQFRNTFLTFASGSCEAAEWSPYFFDYEPDLWDGEGSGAIQFRSDDDKEYTLVILHWSGLGFLLQLSCRNLITNRSEWCKFSVGDRSRLMQFEERDDLRYPVGCFLSASIAWLALGDFLNHPTQPSNRVSWIDDGDVVWPES